MMRKRLFPASFLLLLIFSITGCAFNETYTPETEFDPERHARIRVFHGSRITVFIGDVCHRPLPPNFIASLGAYSYLVQNKTIGMPLSDNMKSSFYHEYIIPANQPITIQMNSRINNGQSPTSCVTRIMFRPLPNHDYEIFRDSYDICSLDVKRVHGKLTPKEMGKGNFWFCKGEWFNRKP